MDSLFLLFQGLEKLLRGEALYQLQEVLSRSRRGGSYGRDLTRVLGPQKRWFGKRILLISGKSGLAKYSNVAFHEIMI